MGLFDIFGTGDQNRAAEQQQAGIRAGLQDLNTQFGSGREALSTNYAAGLQPFQQNFAQAQQGATQYGNALGLNGQAAGDAAVQAFKNNPGYQFQLDQGSQNVLRNQAATGQLNSGKTNVDLQNYGQGVANQGWQQYLQNLLPYLSQQNTAATGIGALSSGLGNQLNANFMGQGNAGYGANTSIGNAQANASLAGLNASANALGALGGIAGLGVKGGGTVGGNALSSLGSALFGFL